MTTMLRIVWRVRLFRGKTTYLEREAIGEEIWLEEVCIR